jgi:hypothetical protein
MKKLLFFLLFSLCYNIIIAQEKKSPDDSLKIYRQVETYSKKKKFTYWLYKEIFNLPDQKKKKEEKQRKIVSYQNLEGKIIRNIVVETFDPFGYSVHDTTRKPSGFVQKGGNFLHQRTTRRAILNQLLFKTGDTLDPLKVKESERILRQSPQIREIAISVIPVKAKSDSVDVYIREQDYWSKAVGLAVEPNRFAFVFSDKNFLGLSHYFNNNFNYYSDEDKYVFSGVYSLPYISHNLIIPSLYYSSDKENFARGFSISRPFISPLTVWAGSMDLFDTRIQGEKIFSEGDTLFYASRAITKDFWLGRSFPLSSDTSEETRSTRFIIGARYLITDYKYHPPDIISPLIFYENSKLYLMSVALSNRTYYRDYYVYRFGVQEDVPAGRLLQLNGGYEDRATRKRYYGSIEAGTGNHFDNFGYLSLRFGLGSFLNKSRFEQSIFKIGIGYFSDLLEIRRTRYRQFVKLDVTYGFNRLTRETITLNDAIKGFESSQLEGTKKAIMSLQTQAYLPYKVLGFRFAPFLIISTGLISPNNESLSKSKLYQGYGIGLLVKNELLVINTFQFAFGFYPNIPERDELLIRLNPIKTYDFNFEDFQSQKPAVIPFN